MPLHYYVFHFMFTEPFKPQELIVHQNKVTKTTMYLSWREPTPSDESIIGYELEYRKNGEDFKKVAKKSLRPEDLCHKATGLSAYTRYGFRVAAFNSAGTGPFTDVVTQFTSKCHEDLFVVATYMYVHIYIGIHVVIYVRS